MNKDVIYIDIEDDITAIIGKVKSAKEKIVALVPPKRVGVLQSAVNLRLLARAATQAHKHLVIITNNPALSALAAAAILPVAKNLQTKPGLAEIPALDIDDGEDIIDGAQLPVGDLARTADTPRNTTLIPVVDDTSTKADKAVDQITKAAAPGAGGTLAAPKAKNNAKVPNFNIFRKKLVLIIGGSILLLAFLIWALFFAPRATIQITARTTDSSINAKVTFDPAATTDLAAATIRSTSQQVNKQDFVDFDATGKKQVGEKATGTMKLTRTSVSSTPITVPAGTIFTAGSVQFASTQDATLGATSVGPGGIIQDTATVNVQATQMGTSSNVATQSYSASVSGFNSQGSAMGGGTDKEITVVTADDVQKATDALLQKDTDVMKDQLKSQFGKDVVVLDTSFMVKQTGAVSAPAVDQEATSGKAKLTANMTYTMTGIEKSQMNIYLDAYFAKQIDGKSGQKVYASGIENATFTNVDVPAGTKATANLVATAQIGPKIDDSVIKSTAAGKRYGEIQSSIEAIPGVSSVDVKFWPFWVTSAPNNTDKINVEFKLDESK